MCGKRTNWTAIIIGLLVALMVSAEQGGAG
jgi:hypothetical protein